MSPTGITGKAVAWLALCTILLVMVMSAHNRILEEFHPIRKDAVHLDVRRVLRAVPRHSSLKYEFDWLLEAEYPFELRIWSERLVESAKADADGFGACHGSSRGPLHSGPIGSDTDVDVAADKSPLGLRIEPMEVPPGGRWLRFAGVFLPRRQLLGHNYVLRMHTEITDRGLEIETEDGTVLHRFFEANDISGRWKLLSVEGIERCSSLHRLTIVRFGRIHYVSEATGENVTFALWAGFSLTDGNSFEAPLSPKEIRISFTDE